MHRVQGALVLHPAGVRLLPIEVAATYDLTAYRPDTTLPGAPEATRPRGGIQTTREIKVDTYLPLMIALTACGYAVVGEPAPAPPGQPPGVFSNNPTSRRIRYPVRLDVASKHVDVPKIHTIILGILGSIPDSAVHAVEAAGASSPALWRDLSSLLVEDLHGSLSFPAQACRAAAPSSAPLAHPPTGVG